MEDIVKHYRNADSRAVYPDIEAVRQFYPFAEFYIKAKVWDYEDEPVEDDFDDYEDYEEACDDYEPTCHLVEGKVIVVAHNYSQSFMINSNPLNDEWAWINLQHKQTGGLPLYDVLDDSFMKPGVSTYSLGDHIFIGDDIMELRIHFPVIPNAKAKVTLERWQD